MTIESADDDLRVARDAVLAGDAFFLRGIERG